MQTELTGFSPLSTLCSLNRSLIFLLRFSIKLTACFITTLGLLGAQCILFWISSYMTTCRYLSLWMESSFSEKVQWSACELGCNGAGGLDRKERLMFWLDAEDWRHWRVPVSSLVLGQPSTVQGWETSTSSLSIKESPGSPFFLLLQTQSVTTFLRRFIKLLGTGLQPQLARGMQQESFVQQLVGVPLVPSRSLAGPQSVTTSEHGPCAWMTFQRRGTLVYISYKLSVLTQTGVKTLRATSGFASPEWSTRQACWVAKEGWWLKLWLKEFREIHPTPGNSFEGNRVKDNKDNFEIESWHFAFHWVSGVSLVLVPVLQQWEDVTRDPTPELISLETGHPTEAHRSCEIQCL